MVAYESAYNRFLINIVILKSTVTLDLSVFVPPIAGYNFLYGIKKFVSAIIEDGKRWVN